MVNLNPTLYSHDVTGPTAAERKPAAGFLNLLRSDVPGWWSADRSEQSRHFRDVIYVAIRAIMDLVGGCSTQVVRRRKPGRKRSTFGPGTVAKAVSAPQTQGNDDEYTPLQDFDHPLCRLISHPNKSETFGEFAAKVVLQNRLTGVAPVWAVPNAKERPVELWALKTALLQPIYQHTKQYPHGAWRVTPYAPSGWAGVGPYGIGAMGAVLPGEEVKRFMDPHPLIDWDGFSPLTAGAVQLDVLESIDESRKAAMDNGLQLDAALVVPGMNDETAKRLQAEMQQRHGGSRNSRRFLVLSPQSGTPEKSMLQTFGQTAREMDFANGWEQMTSFALALFGVPKSVAGLAMASSYSELYAALRQFHSRQGAYIEGRLAAFWTRTLAWPWCSFPDEYLVRVKVPKLDDPDLAETQHSRQCQYDTILYNESRAKDDLPPVPGGDVPVSVFVKMAEQKFAPDPQQAPGMEGDAAGGEDSSPEGVMDDVTSEALESLGVPSEETPKAPSAPTGPTSPVAPKGPTAPAAVAKAFDESKHKRDAGKFSTTSGGGKPVIPGETGRMVGGAVGSSSNRADRRGYSDPTQKQARKKAADHAATPTGKDVLQRAHEWAAQQAEKYADRVAAALQIDRTTAKYLLRTTIEKLCKQALAGGQASQSYTGSNGKRLNLTVKRKQPGGGPTGGGVPKPANPAGAGSRPPMAKALCEGELSAGGALVAPRVGVRKRRRKGYARRLVRKALRGGMT